MAKEFKLKLDDLKVQSFVTNLDEHILGGGFTITPDRSELTVPSCCIDTPATITSNPGPTSPVACGTQISCVSCAAAGCNTNETCGTNTTQTFDSSPSCC